MIEDSVEVIFVADGFIYPNIEFAKGRARAHKLAFRKLGCKWELQITMMYYEPDEEAGVAILLLVVPKKGNLIPRQAPKQNE